MSNHRVETMGDHTNFLNLLAKEINRGSVKFSFVSLKTYLCEAVDALPSGDLKDILQNKSSENADYVWSQIKSAKKSAVKPEFSIFSKDGFETTLDNISQLYPLLKDQLRYMSQALMCYPCSKLYELLLTAQRNESPKMNRCQVLSKVTELCGRLTAGYQNLEVLNGLMQVFLSEIDNINGYLRMLKDMNESWTDLKDIIHRFLIHCHFKQKTLEKGCSNEEISTRQIADYQNILAAIIATYIDVIIAIGEVDQSMSGHTSIMVYLLLGNSQAHLLDVAHQIDTLDSETIKIVLPFFRKVLKTSATCTRKCSNYVKYLCLMWKIKKCINEEMLSFEKSVGCPSAPENFTRWLEAVDSSLILEFGLSSNSLGGKIARKILDCDDKELIERLLDLLSSPACGSNATGHLDDNAEEECETADTNDSLFFVDAQGSSELLEQCREELTNSKSDKILETQISSLSEKREVAAGSDDEGDDFDITLDEGEKEDAFLSTLFDSVVKDIDDAILASPDTNDDIQPENEMDYNISSDDDTNNDIKLDDMLDDTRSDNHVDNDSGVENVSNDHIQPIEPSNRTDNHIRPAVCREKLSEGEGVLDIAGSPQENENLRKSVKKRRKRRSQTSSGSGKVKRSKKQRSLSKTC